MSKPTPAELFYIQHFAGEKTPEEISRDSGIPLRSVKAALRRMRLEADKAAPITARDAAPVAADNPLANPVPFGGDPQKGVVAMTDARSASDDAAQKPAPRHPFFDRYPGCYSLFDPNKPAQ